LNDPGKLSESAKRDTTRIVEIAKSCLTKEELAELDNSQPFEMKLQSNE
jgi:hypothetical protein